MKARPEDRPREGRLGSWKEIAAHLGVSVRTAHRWECAEGLPVRRHKHPKGVSVFAIAAEIERWRSSRVESPAPGTTTLPPRWWHAALLILTVVGAAIPAELWLSSHRSTERRTRIFELPVVPTQTGWPENGRCSRPVLAPRGDRIAFIREGRVWLRELSSDEPHALEDTADAERVFWSPDGEWVGFIRRAAAALGTVWRVPASGGPAALVGSLPAALVYGATWTEDGRIVLATAGYLRWDEGRLWSISAAGGELEPLSPLGDASKHGFLYPSATPSGGALLVATVGPDRAGAVALLSGQGLEILVEHPGETVAFPVYHPAGYVIYQRGLPRSQGLWAVAVDLAAKRATGEPFQVAKNGAAPSVGADGTLLYVACDGRGRQQLAWLDRNGRIVDTVGQPQDAISDPRLSPDGRLALVAGEEEGNVDIWVHDLERSLKTRLTRHPAYDFDPAWAPDGEVVVFSSNRNGAADLFRERADGSGEVVSVVSSSSRKEAARFTPDGRRLFFDRLDEAGADILFVEPSDPRPRPYLDSDALERMPTPSPDGRWLAYVSGETPTASEVWIGPMEAAQGRRQVSPHTGSGPVWSRSGDQLFYVEGNRLMVVDVGPGDVLEVSSPRQLFDATPAGVRLARSDNGQARYDVSLDGARFLAIREVSRSGLRAVVVEGWAP